MTSRYSAWLAAAAAPLILVTLVFTAGCPSGSGKGAYERWGITAPAAGRAGEKEKELAAAYDLLYDLKLKEAKAIYQELVDSFPNSAEAHLGLSMVYRYAGNIPRALEVCEKALELDSNAIGTLINYADLLAPIRGFKLETALSDSARTARGIAAYEQVLESKHPFATYVHTGLWTAYVTRGDLNRARRQMIELGKKHYFPAMLLDFAHNLLVSLEPDAILFTNGDNDTYPLFLLQDYESFRQDVSIVNLSMLNLPGIARLMRDSLNVPVSLADAELEALEPGVDSARDRYLLVSDQLVENIVANAHKRKQPVYFAISVAPERRVDYDRNLVLEGLAWRVATDETGDSSDMDRIIRNMTEEYHLGNVDQAEPWPENFSPLTRGIAGLGMNYVALYDKMAEHYQQQGEDDKAVGCYRDMLRIAKPVGDDRVLRSIFNRWLRLRPDDPEAEKLKQELLG